MTPLSLHFNPSPNRYCPLSSKSVSHPSICYRRIVRSPSIVSHTGLSTKTTPSPKHKARSSASVSALKTLISALKLKLKGKKSAQKVLSPARSVMAELDKRHAKEGLKQDLQRARSLPPVSTWKQADRRKSIASSADGMEVDVDGEEVGEEVGPTWHLYCDASEDPFATPPCTPGPPLSPMMLDEDAEAPASGASSVQSGRKRKAIERSRMKTLQLLGLEACRAISEQYGDMRTPAREI